MEFIRDWTRDNLRGEPTITSSSSGLLSLYFSTSKNIALFAGSDTVSFDKSGDSSFGSIWWAASNMRLFIVGVTDPCRFKFTRQSLTVGEVPSTRTSGSPLDSSGLLQPFSTEWKSFHAGLVPNEKSLDVSERPEYRWFLKSLSVSVKSLRRSLVKSLSVSNEHSDVLAPSFNVSFWEYVSFGENTSSL